MPITLTSLTFSSPDELVSVLSSLEGNALSQLLSSMNLDAERDISPVLKSGQMPSRKLSIATSTGAVKDVVSNDTSSPRSVREKGASAAKVAKRRTRADGPTLIEQIKSVIQQNINKKKEFTANTVFSELEKMDANINKKSVVSSVQKLMQEGSFAKVKREDRRDGSAPRAKKYYMP